MKSSILFFSFKNENLNLMINTVIAEADPTVS